MGTIGERVKWLRKDNGMNATEFGARVGIGKSAVSAIETGVNRPAATTLKSICSEFKVSYLWLTEGIGQVYEVEPVDALDDLTKRFNLDPIDRRIVREYLKLSPDKRKIFRETVRTLFLDDGETDKAEDN